MGIIGPKKSLLCCERRGEKWRGKMALFGKEEGAGGDKVKPRLCGR